MIKVAIVAIAKDETQYIDEWIKYHFDIGISNFYIYQNDWRYPENGKYFSNPKVNWRILDGRPKQLQAYNDFLEHRDTIDADWVMFIDVDEFLKIRSNRSLSAILEEYQSLQALVVNWRIFGDSGLHFDGINFNVMQRFRKCGKNLNRHVKQILNLRYFKNQNIQLKMMNPHFGNWISYNQEKQLRRSVYNDTNLNKVHELELNHYATKTLEELSEKIKRGRSDSCHLNNFNAYYSDFNLNEIDESSLKYNC